MTVKAPFNFVPLNDNAYYPDWADLISHDIPFEDGISGTIELKLTAKTPIFVRNGHKKEDDENRTEAYKDFSNNQGEYFIPGTSIKGAVRSVLEIISFGKMSTQETHKYACKWGDDGFYPNSRSLFKEIKTGWLKKDEKGYYIEECEYARIGFDKIDDFLGGKVFKNSFSKGHEADFNVSKKDPRTQKEIGVKSSAYKYASLKGKEIKNLHFSVCESINTPYVQIRRLEVNDSGPLKGSIVMTGQPNTCKWIRPKELDSSAGKFYEFVFLDNDNPGKRYDLSDEGYKDFDEINQNNYQWSEVWKAEVGRDSQVPVFFRASENNRVKNLGLSYLYKIPCDVSPVDCIPDSLKENRCDLAECIFGYVSKDRNTPSLKGRVQFGHAWLINKPETQDEKYVLSSPKASYYPLYVKGENHWIKGAELAGRKRYVVREEEYKMSLGNDAMESEGRVLKKGAEFSEIVTFHNLKPIELGAVLSALTFDNHDECLHSIGQGKPFGWGSVKMTIENVKVDSKCFDEISCRDAFKEAVLAFGKWEESASIKALLKMAKPIPADQNEANWYMNLEKREFSNAKKDIGRSRSRSSLFPQKRTERSSAPREAKKTPVKINSTLKNFKNGRF